MKEITGTKVLEFDKETGLSEVGSLSIKAEIVFDEEGGTVYNARVRLPDNWEQSVIERFLDAARRTITNIKGEEVDYNRKGYAEDWAYEYIQSEAEESAAIKAGLL